MSRIIQHRRGTFSQHENFIGAPGEITFDTDLQTLRVHDGVTCGGIQLAKQSSVGSIPDYTSPGTTLPIEAEQWHSIPSRGILFIEAHTTDVVSWLTLLLGSETSYTAFTTQINVGARGFNIAFPVKDGTKYKLSPFGSVVDLCKLIPFCE